MPVTRTTKMPIVWVFVVVETVGCSTTLVSEVCSDCRHVVVHVTAGTSSALDSAIESPPQLDWIARVCGVGASAPRSIGGLRMAWSPGVRS